MGDKRLPRREREKLQQRRELLAAALTLFSENGYHNVSHAPDRRQGRVAIGTLYKFFQTRRPLQGLVREKFEAFHSSLWQAIKGRVLK
jgi:AcrR family transcriptional regulator